MRDLILKLHMYGGLLCSSYLIIFGLSATRGSLDHSSMSQAQGRRALRSPAAARRRLSSHLVACPHRNRRAAVGR